MGKPFFFKGSFASTALIFLLGGVAANSDESKLSIKGAQQDTQSSTLGADALNPPDKKPGKISIKSTFTGVVQGLSIQDGVIGTSAGVALLRSTNNARYNSWLSFDLGFVGFFVEGNTKNLFNSDGKSSDGFYLEDAIVNIEPSSWLMLRGGIFMTQTNSLLSVMSRIPFPGAQQRVSFPLGSANQVTLTAFEGVPVASGVSKGFVDPSPNAFYLSQSAQIESELRPLKSKVTTNLSRFEFGNLSSNIAVDSALIGNDPRSFEGAGTNYRYKIGFGGYELASQIETQWTARYKTTLKGAGIINLEAPEDRRTGVQGYAGVTAKFGNVLITPAVKLFRMEADVIPASYQYLPSRSLNRQGYTGSLSLELEEEKITFYGSYTKGEVIQPSAYISDREMYAVGVEAKYDVL